jgi:hypothetical protein
MARIDTRSEDEISSAIGPISAPDKDHPSLDYSIEFYTSGLGEVSTFFSWGGPELSWTVDWGNLKGETHVHDKESRFRKFGIDSDAGKRPLVLKTKADGDSRTASRQ